MQVERIKPEALISIQISADFYTRLQYLATYLYNSVDIEEVTKQIELISQDSDKISEFGSNLETILILIKEIESKAIEQKLTEFVNLTDGFNSNNKI